MEVGAGAIRDGILGTHLGATAHGELHGMGIHQQQVRGSLEQLMRSTEPLEFRHQRVPKQLLQRQQKQSLPSTLGNVQRAQGDGWQQPWDDSSYSGWRWSWNGPWSWHDGAWRGGGSWHDTPPPKPDYSDPPGWPGWSHRRQWTVALRRWHKSTDLPMHRRAEKVLRSFGWEMQADFEHISEATLASSDYIEAILKVIDNKAGVREDDEKRRAFKAVMSENNKRKDETLAQYAVRRQREFRKASDFGVSIPAELQASMLREGALLSEQNLQNLTTLVGNSEYDPEAICRALGRMDVRSDRLVGYVTEENETFLELGKSEPSESEEDEEVILAELDNMSLYEDQVHEVYAVLEARKRTWKENKIYKANLKKDRGRSPRLKRAVLLLVQLMEVPLVCPIARTRRGSSTATS